MIIELLKIYCPNCKTWEEKSMTVEDGMFTISPGPMMLFICKICGTKYEIETEYSIKK